VHYRDSQYGMKTTLHVNMYHTHRNSLVSEAVGCYPAVQQSLSGAGSCTVCREPFVNSWLECAQFVPAREVGACITIMTPHHPH